jgi:spore germination protein GerM
MPGGFVRLYLAAGLVAGGCGVPSRGPVDVGPAPAAGSQESAAPRGDSSTLAVTIYLLEKGALRPVNRDVPRTPRVGTETLTALLVGPTKQESSRGLTTAIPRATSLLGLVINEGLASVNLSSQFRSNADSSSLTLGLAQVTCTLASFLSITAIQFAFDGRVASVPIGNGAITDRPVTCADYSQ